jgi:hypothetical protein
VRERGEGYELVAGVHRMAAARPLGLADVPVTVRQADSEDADRAVENITSCRRRHEAIYADRVVMPMFRLECPAARCEPGGEVSIRTPEIQAVRLRQTAWLKVIGCRSASQSSARPGTRRHARIRLYEGGGGRPTGPTRSLCSAIALARARPDGVLAGRPMRERAPCQPRRSHLAAPEGRRRCRPRSRELRNGSCTRGSATPPGSRARDTSSACREQHSRRFPARASALS